LKIRVEIRPQLKQGLQPDFHEQVIRDPIDGSPEELDSDQRQAQQGNPHTPIARYGGPGTQEIVDDYFKWPGLEQIQTNTDNRQKQSEDRLPKEWAVITEDAPVDRHGEFQISDYGLNTATYCSSMARDSSRPSHKATAWQGWRSERYPRSIGNSRFAEGAAGGHFLWPMSYS
jgi:hypothetical protein